MKARQREKRITEKILRVRAFIGLFFSGMDWGTIDFFMY
jgi:uncharacterized membrane protein YsdA (DUF1294 family)